jgi:predicted transcriptional regulator
MTKEQIETVLDRVRSWPKERQEEAVEMLLYLETKGEVYILSDEERESVRQGLAEAERGEFASDEEIEALFGRFRK